MKKNFLVLSALTIFLAGCGDVVKTPPVNVGAAPNTITYTDSGFLPDTITIKAGTTVSFVNQSSSEMWVASNPHPTHTDLPGFDEKESVANGGSYQFTFNQLGTWGYHNHNNPGNKGEVVVE